jgi:hypothetical protein
MRRAFLALMIVLGLARLAAADDEVVPWDEAEKHVGQSVIVEGRVMGIHCSPTSCLLAFDPSFNRFTAVVQAARFGVFPPDRLDSLYTGRKVRVHGTVQTIDKKPEIILDAPGDISVVTTKADREQKTAETAQAQVETLERLEDVLSSVQELTERLADTQMRMDALLAQMEQRQAALASLPAPQSPPPPPSYGTPQPRPAYESLRTVKQGMSPADVARLIGEPQAVEEGSGGWVTWYYGYGRSISFDPRGRARSLVGFPAP